MPVSIAATIAKQTARRALAEITVHPDPDGSWVTGYLNADTTSGGSATTAIIAAFSGIGSDYLLATPWTLCNDLDNAGAFRRATGFAGTTVTTVAFANTVATATDMDFYPYRPSLYTQAFNRAIPKMYPGIYRYLTNYVIANSSRGSSYGNLYSLPRNMRRLHGVTRQGSPVLRDLFEATDSATAVEGWTGASGDTIGISTQHFYFVGDADGDYATRPERIRNGVIEFTVRGTVAHNTTYRTVAIMFRHAEDYAGTLDHNNYLVVRILSSTTAATGGRVDLRKVDRGTESSLTTGSLTTTNDVDYRVRVEFIGKRIAVWVDDIQYIDYELTGLNEKYMDYDRYGLRLDKGGSPGTDARVGEVYAFETTTPIEWTDIRTVRGGRTFELGSIGSTSPTGILLIEGTEQLTLFDADSTGSLTNDSTAVLELATTNEAFQTLVQASAVELYAMLGFTELRKDAEAVLATMPRMERVRSRGRHVQLA